MLAITTWLCFLFLRISDYHTYFVSGEDWGFSVWSHNLNGDCAIVQKIVAERASHHMPALPQEFRRGDGNGTVAIVVDHNHQYVGINTAFRTTGAGSEDATMRAFYTQMVGANAFAGNNVSNYGFGRSNFLLHAEAMAIIADYNANNHSVTSGLTAFVDRPTCQMCQNNLPFLLRYIHVTSIKFKSVVTNAETPPITDTLPTGNQPATGSSNGED